MKKFFEYFYIFSKLSTSIILFVTVIFMGYLLYNSYIPENKELKLSNENFLDITKAIDKNQKQITQLSNQLKNKIIEIENIQNNKNKEMNTNNIIKKVENLSLEISDLKNNFKSMEDKLANLDTDNLSFGSTSLNNSSLEDIKNIIFIKFMNNSNIDNEIEILSKITDSNNSHYIDKIKILKKELFFNYDQLINEFNITSENYFKKNIINSKSNYFIKFLSPIINIEPSNKKIFLNHDVGIIKDAKQYLLIKNFKQCIDGLNQLKFEDKNLNILKSKINIYSDLTQTLNLLK